MSEFKEHEGCEKCGSSDGKAVYGDGSAYCFVCETYYHPVSSGTAYQPKQPKRTSALNYLVEDILELPIVALPHRNISKDVTEYFGVRSRFSTATGEITHTYYPYYNAEGALVGYKERDVLNKAFRVVGSLGTGLFGYNKVKTGGKLLLACEGEEDCLAAHQMLKEQGKSYSVVSVATGANAKHIKDNLEFIESYETVIINFDMDKAGHEGATKCLEVIQVGKGKRAKLPEGFKDNSELWMGSPTASKEFLSSIYNAKSFRPDGIVDMSEAWDVLFSDDNMLSIPYPWAGLNEKTYGCRYREIVTLTAATGGGKSQVVRELEHWLLNNTQDNIGILALEEGTGRTGWGLISVEANLPLSIREERKNVSKEMIKGWFDKTLGTGRVFSFDHFGSTTEENILARVRYMIKALDCKWIFLDHLSIVVSGMEDGGDERKTIDSIMTKLRMLVEETGAGLFLVSHLKRVSGNQGHENGVEVSISHLRGSQAIAQLSDMVIALERNQQADDPVEANTTTIRVLKNRYAGLTGVACKLVYDRDTGRLSEKEEDEDAQDF